MQVTSVRLSVAERADIIVDFGKIKRSRLYLVNRLEQVNGRGPTGKILTPGTPIIQFNDRLPLRRTTARSSAAARQLAFLCATARSGLHALLAKAAKAKTRILRFERGNGAWQVNGRFFDENVVNAAIRRRKPKRSGSSRTPAAAGAHPIHIHFEERRVLSRNGVPIKPNTSVNGTIDYARRDVVPLNINNEVRDLHPVPRHEGRYVMHCHNVVHEDHAMMIRWDIVKLRLDGARPVLRAGRPPPVRHLEETAPWTDDSCFVSRCSRASHFALASSVKTQPLHQDGRRGSPMSR